MNHWVSPRLGVHFELAEDQLRLRTPDGREFLTYLELFDRSQQDRQLAERERQRADREWQRAERERQSAEHERQRADRLAQQLRALGVNPEA